MTDSADSETKRTPITDQDGTVARHVGECRGCGRQIERVLDDDDDCPRLTNADYSDELSDRYGE